MGLLGPTHHHAIIALLQILDWHARAIASEQVDLDKVNRAEEQAAALDQVLLPIRARFLVRRAEEFDDRDDLPIQSITDLQARFPSLAMGNFLQTTPLPDDGGVELSVDPERFHDIFCADVPDDVAAFMAHAKRPLVATAFEEPAAAAAWRTKPSWGVFGTGDRPIAPELHRFSHSRAGSTVTEVEGASHFVMVSEPGIVAGVIRDAVKSVAMDLAA